MYYFKNKACRENTIFILSYCRYQDGDVVWINDRKKIRLRNTDLASLEWKETSEFSDVHILSKDGESFNVHKCMLAARSEYFHHMLAGGWIEVNFYV